MSTAAAPPREIALPHGWLPREYQKPAWDYFAKDHKGRRAVLLWHRRAGKDLFSLNLCAVEAHKRVGVYWHIFPTYAQAKKAIWFGVTSEGRRFLDYFPDELVESRNVSELRVTFKNGSVYQLVGADNCDSLMGSNPVGTVWSEYSIMDPTPWDFVRPILSENGGWACFIYTARGDNHGHALYTMAKDSTSWFCEKRVAGDKGTKRDDGTPVISDAQIQIERDAGMDESFIQQEFFNAFKSPAQGAFYEKEMLACDKDGHITDVPYDPRLPVGTTWDVGFEDATAIWFYQEYRGVTRFIDYHEENGKDITHFIKVIRNKPYAYNKHIGPWDLELGKFGGNTPAMTALQHGLRFRITPHHKVLERVDAVRGVFPRCRFDEDKCAQGLTALRGYRKKWDRVTQMFKASPVRDGHCHGADSFGYYAFMAKTGETSFEDAAYATTFRRGAKTYGKPETPKAVDDYDYLSGCEGGTG